MSSTRKVLALLGVLVVLLLWSSTGFAQGQGAAAGSGIFSMWGWLGVAAGFGIAVAAAGGGIGQGRAVGAAMEGIARNPGSVDAVSTWFIVGIALIESLVIYAFVVALLLQAKIPAHGIDEGGAIQVLGG